MNAAPQPGSAECGAEPPSPCINVCRMDPANGYCVGCWRTLDEIAQWGGASATWKRAVWTQLRQRRGAGAGPGPGPGPGSKPGPA